ncbi:ABC-type bacteriocin/lantibiotic exporter with double-glycine peptidase domain [Phyllobacterium leguminum]|uniref:ABC-type bacteriocin/lantibiotic exporter with double-glycine peptidase domain n=2 Tax=Phyllobacterium leguminum TaxID=314237 RepID=A0A318T7Y5_9HYPH|nr:ABC-type bacteriocin/lantibiotic exporter with double-glycine peptidase domain [Phyllobacterium leguminum]
MEALKNIKLPALLHWGFNHYVVLSGLKNGLYTILDPAQGRFRLRENELSRFFTGIAVEFSSNSALLNLSQLHKIQLKDLFLSAPHAQCRIILILAVALITSISVFIFPVYFRAIIEAAVGPKNIISIYIILAITCVILFMVFVFSYVKHRLTRDLSKDIEHSIATILNDAIFNTSFAFFVRKTPSMIARYYQNLRRVRQIISEGIIDSIVDLIILLVLMIATFAFDTTFGLALVFITLLYFTIIYRLQRNRMEMFKRTAAADNHENLTLMDNLRNIQAIKLNGLEGVRSAIWQVAYRRAASAHDALNGLSAKTDLVGNTWLGVGRCGLVALAAFEVLHDKMTIENFLSLSLFQAFLTMSLANLARRLTGLLDIQYMLSDMSTLIAAERDPMLIEPNRDRKNQTVGDLSHLRGEGSEILLCRDVDFRFDPASRRLLKKVNIEVRRHEIIAITGRTGAGKSTLLRVLTGLLPTEEGNITWLGKELQSWSRQNLVRHVATVMQEDQIFSGTLLQNIAHFSSDPDMERVKESCSDACVSVFLDRLPMGLYTPVASNSAVLSVGEKQRIFLARAFYTRAEVLLLDEFTGNLDMETEAQIFESLRRLKKTIIMTAHRESTIQQADRVYNLDRDHGTLVEVSH